METWHAGNIRDKIVAAMCAKRVSIWGSAETWHSGNIRDKIVGPCTKRVSIWGCVEMWHSGNIRDKIVTAMRKEGVHLGVCGDVALR